MIVIVLRGDIVGPPLGGGGVPVGPPVGMVCAESGASHPTAVSRGDDIRVIMFKIHQPGFPDMTNPDYLLNVHQAVLFAVVQFW